MTKQVNGVRPALRQLRRCHLRPESFIVMPEACIICKDKQTEQNFRSGLLMSIAPCKLLRPICSKKHEPLPHLQFKAVEQLCQSIVFSALQESS